MADLGGLDVVLLFEALLEAVDGLLVGAVGLEHPLGHVLENFVLVNGGGYLEGHLIGENSPP